MMKKIFLMAVVALFSTGLLATTLSTSTSYVSVQNTPAQGLNYGLTYGFNVFEGTGFVKDITLGANGNLTMLNGSTYDVFLAPMLKVSIPWAYAEMGFGYDIIKTAGVNSNDYAWVAGAGVEGSLTPSTKVAFGFDAKYDIKAATYSWLIGPSFTFAL